jgi:glycosyltransferase involved in cell wall biosynthesis
VSASPKIAYLTSLYPAASHTFVLREVTALRDLGLEVETCSIRRPDAAHLIGPEEQAAFDSTFFTVQSAKNPGYVLKSLGNALRQPGRFLSTLGLAWRTAPPGVKGAFKQTIYLAEAILLAQHLRDKGIEHLHNHFANSAANVAMMAAELNDIRFSYTLHGPTDLLEPDTWHLEDKTNRASFVSCISYFARSQVMLFSKPEQWDKLKIIHCGVIPERYETDAAPVDSTGTELIFVGRLAPVKGVRILLEAFTKARETRPDLTLTLVGDGEDRAHLEHLAAPLGDAVNFRGFLSQEEVAAALAKADVLVLPSFAEGLPVVLMEALAARRAVICTQVAGVGELVEEGVSGFRVPPSDVDTLAARIGQLADDPELRRSMGEVGQKKVRADFDIRIEAGKLAQHFRDAAS